MRIAEHRRHGIKPALGLKFRGGQVGYLLRLPRCALWALASFFTAVV